MKPNSRAENSQNYFSGAERLENFHPLQRPIRCGSPAELAIGDKKRITAALRAEDAVTALSYNNPIFYGHRGLIEILFEWSLQWSHAAFRNTSAADERKCTEMAFRYWAEDAGNLIPQTSKLLSLKYILGSNILKPETAQQFNNEKKDCSGHLTNPLKVILDMQQKINEHISMNRFQDAEVHLDKYWITIVMLHDSLVQYCHSYPAAVSNILGQKTSEIMIHDSFSGSSFFEGLWYLGTNLNPEQLAAFLAEHLRLHCSGQTRGGDIEIIEDADAFRLVFAPCGSGGALRRRLSPVKDIEVLKEPSSANWHKGGQVPFYCSHCAYNEIESIKRLGYPVLVTEFDPDPFKPCGWTVYKSPSLVPKYYFERLAF